MNLHNHQATRVLAGFVILVLLAAGGCSFWGGDPRQKSQTVQTNLYGNLNGWQPVAFSAKPFASLVQHSFCEEGGDYDPSVSADGKWIVFSSLRHCPNPDLYIKQAQGFTTTRLTSDPASEIQPSFSPQSDKVAYASNRTGDWDIWVIGVDGSNPVRLTAGAGNDIHPSWSPDGKQIVYCSLGGRSNQWELWVVNVENPSVKKWIGYGLFPEWCPNAKIPKIAFQQSRYRGSQWFSIWTIDFVNDEAKYPTEIVSSVDYACICPSWSPDGSKLAYSTVGRTLYEKGEGPVPQSSGEDIWTVDLDGRNNLRLTHTDASNFSPCWGPDGRVYFCSDRKNIENIWSIQPHQIQFARENPVDLSQHPLNSVRANF
ncbi:MAG: TolB family protein [Sedimentisphaerales bacterium]|nr:TolB family protein [Sedimentisphaerales bacterium]